MPMVVNGLPAHVLLVHFVVVLVPATVLLLVLSVAWRSARERIGIFGPLLAALTLIIAIVAAQAGDWLKHKLEADDDLINQHANFGTLLEYAAGAVFVLYAVWWTISSTGGEKVLAKLGPLQPIAKNKLVQIAVAVAAVAVSALALYLVVMVGDTGAQATWSGYKDLLTK